MSGLKRTSAKPSAKPAAVQGYDQADAWVNLEVIDGKGNPHKMPKGTPLYQSQKVPNQLIQFELKKIQSCKEQGIEYVPTVFKFTGTINITALQDDTPIEF